jgi:cbb3-type cytochrome oxidase subunit 3
MMILPLLAVALLLCLPIIAVVALLYKPGKQPSRDRSAQSMQPLACGCTMLLLVGFVALIYYATHSR